MCLRTRNSMTEGDDEERMLRRQSGVRGMRSEIPVVEVHPEFSWLSYIQSNDDTIGSRAHLSFALYRKVKLAQRSSRTRDCTPADERHHASCEM